MTDYLDYGVILLPLFAALISFLAVAVIFSRGLDGITRFERFARIFLSEGATLKTWGLFLSALMLCLLLAGAIAKMATDATWTKLPATEHDRILFFRDIAIGLEILLAIVLGAFGAVAFKGQGPGGVSFQLNQDTAGNVTQSGTAPVAPPVAAKGG